MFALNFDRENSDKESLDKKYECPIATAIGIISGKWKPLILCELRDRPMRFGELRRGIDGVSEKVLTDRLRELEADGILVRRKFYEGAVLATEYSFTAYGRTV